MTISSNNHSFQVKALLFDMDGVVIDSERFRDIAMANLLSSFGIIYDRDAIKPHLSGKSSVDCMRFIVNHYQLPETAEVLDANRREEIARLYRDEIPFVPGFVEFYRKIVDTYQFPCAIATGCDKDYFNAIDARLGLTDLFSGHIYRSDMVLNPKPAPDIFVSAAQKLGVSSQECVVFEDAPLGIAAAFNAHAKVVTLTRTFNQESILRSLLNPNVNVPTNGMIFVPDYSEKSYTSIATFLGLK